MTDAEAIQIIADYADSLPEYVPPSGQLGQEHLAMMSAQQIIDAAIAGQFEKLLGTKGIK